jgi:hypothetical protein
LIEDKCTLDREEALKLLSAKLDDYRKLPYTEAVARVGGEEILEVTGPSGLDYQIEIQIVWDGKPGGDVRVLGAIDDGGWRAFLPLTSDLIVTRDASGEK